jgi:hypothetical protein
MPEIQLRGKVTGFNPGKGILKVSIETDLNEESAKLLWLIDKGVDIVLKDNQTTLEVE